MEKPAISDVNSAAALLAGLADGFATREGLDIPASECALLETQVARIEQALPGLLPPFDAAYLRGPWVPAFGLYKTARVRRWLEVALSRLRAAQERATTDPLELPPAQGSPTFDFVEKPELREILRRDFAEIERALAARCWKAVIIMSGGLAEGLLADAISRCPTAPAKQKGNLKAATDMRLVDLIRMAQELGLVGRGVGNLSDTLREYRNLVHVGVEMRGKLQVDEHEARLALVILRMVERDLSELRR